MEEAAIQSVVLSLAKLLAEELSYLDAVRDKVEQLDSELNVLAAFLEDAGKKCRQQDEVLRNMLFQARAVAYDCEDVIDEYTLKVALHNHDEYKGRRPGSIIRWACNFVNNPIRLHRIRSEIDGLNTRISSVRTRMRDYGVRPKRDYGVQPNDSPAKRDYGVHIHDREEHVVVGLEQHLDQLLDKLVNSDRTLIAIYGMHGIGKTTLAIELYHNHQIRSHFEKVALAHVSRPFRTDGILQQLLYLLASLENEQKRRAIEEDIKAGQAHRAIYKVMMEFRCLVIIDDIGTSTEWAKLERAFPRRTATGSKILLTTRNKEIVSGLDQHMVYLHSIRGLNDGNSWELFEKTAFPGATCPDPEKEGLGQEMLKHCRGVPLAITVLGKVLKAKGSVNEWKQMRDNIAAQIERVRAPNQPYIRECDVLRVSYDALQPSYLKHCFLHLAMFPENYEIPVERLFKLWVSEGIILKEHSHESEEDAAERCLNELVSRNMVQVGRREVLTDRIETCRLPDLMKDICIRIASDEGFFQIISCQRPMLFTSHGNGHHLSMNPVLKRDRRLRRLAVYVTDQGPRSSTLPPAAPVRASPEVSGAPHLRSVSVFSVAEQNVEEDSQRFTEAICKDFPLLRVFDCGDLLVKGKLPKKVGNLIHLRYLSLANTRITELPSSIDKLLLLQTLDLRVNEDTVISLPNLLWKLKQLRHLYLPYFGGLEILEQGGVENFPQRYLIKKGELLRLDGLQNLQTIQCLDLDRANLQGVSELSGLKTLSATCVTKEVLCHILHCSSLKKVMLRLHAQILNEDPIILSCREAICEVHIHSKPCNTSPLRIPLCLEMFPKSLAQVGFWYVELPCDPLPILEKLPNLIRLDLHVCYNGSRMVCTAGGFPELIDLTFDRLPNFSDWEVEKGALPKLRTLHVMECPIEKAPAAIPRSVYTVLGYND